MTLVPNFGGVIALLGPAFSILVSQPSMYRLCILLGMYAVIVVIDQLMLQPLIMKRVTRVPVWASILAPIVLGIVIPFWGILLAPPLLAIVYAFRRPRPLVPYFPSRSVILIDIRAVFFKENRTCGRRQHPEVGNPGVRRKAHGRKCYTRLSPRGLTAESAFLQAVEVPMSGHSKWATIKHKKGALDAKRGKIFTRLIREITMAARQGGGDPDANPRLRGAVAAAKAENMPADNIKRAIQRGTGELPGSIYEEISFEGYGPGGVALIVEVTTDNRNRTVSEVRHAFSKNGGNLGEPNSVRFMFAKKGLIAIPKAAADEDKLMNIVLDAGGEDLNDEGENWEILTDPSAYEAVANAVKAAKVETSRLRDHDDCVHLHQAGRHRSRPDDPAARSPGRPGRRAERLLEFRSGRHSVRRSRWLESPVSRPAFVSSLNICSVSARDPGCTLSRLSVRIIRNQVQVVSTKEGKASIRATDRSNCFRDHSCFCRGTFPAGRHAPTDSGSAASPSPGLCRASPGSMEPL